MIGRHPPLEAFANGVKRAQNRISRRDSRPRFFDGEANRAHPPLTRRPDVAKLVVSDIHSRFWWGPSEVQCLVEDLCVRLARGGIDGRDNIVNVEAEVVEVSPARIVRMPGGVGHDELRKTKSLDIGQQRCCTRERGDDVSCGDVHAVTGRREIQTEHSRALVDGSVRVVQACPPSGVIEGLSCSRCGSSRHPREAGDEALHAIRNDPLRQRGQVPQGRVCHPSQSAAS